MQTILAFIVALGVLVTAHEFGHYWVARKLGVKILRFSVGFGKPLYCRRQGLDRTEFVIAVLPLGGYVKMLDERESEVALGERHRAFNRQSLATRVAIVSAGPAANFALAFASCWVMFLVGITGLKPIIGDVSPDSIAARAGLKPGMQIVEVKGAPTPTWDGVLRRSLDAILDSRPVGIVVREPSGFERHTSIDFSNLSVDDMREGDFLDEIGVSPLRPLVAPRIQRVVAGKAAAAAGMAAGDLVTAADGDPITGWAEWVDVIRSSPGRPIVVEVRRGDTIVALTLVPAAVESDGEIVGRIGAEVSVPENIDPVLMGVERFGPIEALARAGTRTWEMSVTTLKFLYKMIAGEASVKNLSGPISIAHYAGQSAKLGVARFLEFLALVSVSLAVLNLLPIPILDGGHLLYYLIEFVTRRPVSEHIQAYGQQIGLVMLLSLMGLAVYNDIMRIM